MSADADAAPVDEELAFDPTDMSRTKDWDLLARARAKAPVVRPAPGLAFTTRYAATQEGFKDAKRFSSVGDMRAPGVTVPELTKTRSTPS